MGILEKKILSELRTKGKAGIRRSDLANILKIPRTTLYDALLRLKLAGKVESYRVFKNRPGRPNTNWRVK